MYSEVARRMSILRATQDCLRWLIGSAYVQYVREREKWGLTTYPGTDVGGGLGTTVTNGVPDVEITATVAASAADAAGASCAEGRCKAIGIPFDRCSSIDGNSMASKRAKAPAAPTMI
jgi:hypothetical protein